MDMTSPILHHHVCVDHLIRSSEAHWQGENVSNECDDDDDEGEKNSDLGWWHSLRACVEYLKNNGHGNTGNYRFKVWDSCSPPFFVTCLQLPARSASDWLDKRVLLNYQPGFAGVLLETLWWMTTCGKERNRTIIKHSLIPLWSSHIGHNDTKRVGHCVYDYQWIIDKWRPTFKILPVESSIFCLWRSSQK